MNPYTTDHPLVAQPSWFDKRAYPILSLLCSGLVLALVLTPFLFGWMWFLANTDEVQSTDDPPFPQSLAEFLLGTGVAFVISLFLAFLLAGGFRLAPLLLNSNPVKSESPTGARDCA